jgi:tetratricopeptide (TPR) repeat protein
MEHRLRRAAESLERKHEQTIAAVRSGNRQAVAVAAARELRDSQRHQQLLWSNEQVRQSMDAVERAVVSGFNALIAHAVEQTALLHRIASALENPRSTQAAELRRMAVVHYGANDWRKAERLLREALGLDATVHATYLMLAEVLRRRSALQEAYRILDESLPYAEGILSLPKDRWSVRSDERKRRARAYTLQYMGLLCEQMGRRADAIGHLLEALEDEGYEAPPGIHLHIARLYLAQGEHGMAAAAYLELCSKAPALAIQGYFDTELRGLRPLMVEMIEEQSSKMRETATGEVRAGEASLTQLRKLRKEALRYNTSVTYAQSEFEAAEKAVAALRALAGDAAIMTQPYDAVRQQLRTAIGELRAKYPEVEMKKLRSAYRRRRRKRIFYVSATALVAALFYAGHEADQLKPPETGSRAGGARAVEEAELRRPAVAEGARPRFDSQLGQRIVEHIFSIEPDPGKGAPRQQWTPQVLAFSLIFPSVRGEAGAVYLGGMYRFITMPQDSWAEARNFMYADWSRINITLGEVIVDANRYEKRIDRQSLAAFDTYLAKVDSVAHVHTRADYFRELHRRLLAERRRL